MVGADALVAQLMAQRLRAVELGGGVSIKYEIPSAFAAMALSKASSRGDGDEVIRLTGQLIREWEGVTQATVLGAAVGSSDPAPFDPRLWRVLAGDRPSWALDAGNAMLAAAIERHEAAAVSAKN
jgi:hypothetical protein